MYRERPSRLPGAVVWRGSDAPAGAAARVLPDGCMDLLWVNGTLLVAGPDTTAFLATVPSAPGYVGLRLPPGAGPGVVGLPAHELRDQRVPLADVWPAAQVRRLTERVDQAQDRGAALEEIARGRLDSADPTAALIAARLRAGSSVAATAEAIGLGERQLHRRCLAAFGYGAKTLARILRLNRAVAAARSGESFAAVAAVCGYADQAHLAREVQELAGLPLGALIR
jgi:AraC-like DNA-binding protein